MLFALSSHGSPPGAAIGWLGRSLAELFHFGVKSARACLFAGLFFAAIFLIPRGGILGLPRYDALLVVALAIQVGMVWLGLETIDELKAVSLFHAVGFGLEAFKTSHGSWSYPDFAYTRFFGVPLFSGFMYAAVGSYITQAWRLFDLRVERHPPYWMATAMALAIYLNFFTHHFIGDLRWFIVGCAVAVYARTVVHFRPWDRDRTMPLLLSFVLIGFFVWLAENLSTFFHVWSYPEQLHGWATVHVGKWSSWSLLVIMTFTIVTSLKHIKHRIQVVGHPCSKRCATA